MSKVLNASDMDSFMERNMKEVMLSFIENRMEEFFDNEVLEDYFSEILDDFELDEEEYEQINKIIEYWNHEMEKAFTTLSNEKVPFQRNKN